MLSNHLLTRLWQFADHSKSYMVISLILSAVSAVFMLLPFIYLWKVIQLIFLSYPNIKMLDSDAIIHNGYMAVVFAILGWIAYFISLLCSHAVAFQIAKTIKVEILQHLSRVPLGFFSQNPSGKVKKIIEHNSAQTEHFVAHQLPDLVGAIVTPLATLFFLFYFDWRLGILSIVPLIIGFVIQFRMMDEGGKVYMQNVQDAAEDMNAQAIEYVRGIPVIKVFQQTVFSFKKFHEAIVHYKNNIIHYSLACEKPMNLFNVFIHAAFLFLIPAGILFFEHADHQVEFLIDWLFYLLFTPVCATMLMKIMYVTNYKMQTDAALQRVETLLQTETLTYVETTNSLKHYTVQFQHVSFTYPNSEQQVLTDINFTAHQGQITAIVGPSGGGKSTIASLIPRFYDVTKGVITIDGIDIQQLPEQELMQKIAFVFQNTKLFKMSIAENLRLAKNEATEEEMRQALIAAQCQTILEKLPNGIHTIIGQKGIYLSGGEQQRIALAQAILKDAPIIILDEATAFADAENEHLIQKAFEHLTRNKTVIMIAHRLTTIQKAQQILVVQNGVIQERGNHETLLQQQGLYKEMWDNYQLAAQWTVNEEETSC